MATMLAGCGRPDPIDRVADLAVFDDLIASSLDRHLRAGSFDVTYTDVSVAETDPWQVDYTMDAAIRITSRTALLNCPPPDKTVLEVDLMEVVPRFLFCPALRQAAGDDGTIDSNSLVSLPATWRFEKQLRPDGNAQSYAIRWTGAVHGVKIRTRDNGTIETRQVIIPAEDAATTTSGAQPQTGPF